MIYLIIVTLIVVLIFIHFVMLKENVKLNKIFTWDLILFLVIFSICVGVYGVKQMKIEFERKLLNQYYWYQQCSCHFREDFQRNKHKKMIKEDHYLEI